jgi:hypothetical protein
MSGTGGAIIKHGEAHRLTRRALTKCKKKKSHTRENVATAADRIDSNGRTPERGPVGGGKEIRCLSEKDTTVSVLKDECEKSERSFGTSPAAVWQTRREGRSRLLDEVCELCGYERKYAIKVLSGKRAIMGSKGCKRGGSQAIYGEAEREVIKAI